MNLVNRWLVLDEVSSTQEVAADLVRKGRSDIGVVFAHDQLKGKGRFGRIWKSERGESLTFSLILWHYADWPRPWLIGMATAIAVAQTIDCQLRWPNDLTFDGLKTGGILTELFSDTRGRQVPVVGIGINLRQSQFPPELAHATSIRKATDEDWEAERLGQEVLIRLSQVPEPVDWDWLAEAWSERDDTPGKPYRLADGRIAAAARVSHDGSLICSVEGNDLTVLAAEALFMAKL